MVTEKDIKFGLHFHIGSGRGFVISEPIGGMVLYEYDSGHRMRHITDRVSTFLSLVNCSECKVVSTI